MTEPDGRVGEDEWAASLLFDPEPSAAPLPVRDDGEDLGHHDDDEGSVPASVEFDAPPTPITSVGADAPIDANAGAKKTAVVLGAGLLVLGSVAYTVALAITGGT